jgi:hypothetical protein
VRKIKQEKKKIICLTIAPSMEQDFRKEIQPILEKYEKRRYQEAVRPNEIKVKA